MRIISKSDIVIFNSLYTNSIMFLGTFSSAHCVKIVRFRSCSGPYFPAFELNTEWYGVSLRIQSECGKMLNRIKPNTGTFHAVANSLISQKNIPCKGDETVPKWKILSREATGNTGRKIWHTGVPKEIYQIGRLSVSPRLDKYA